MDKCKQVFIFIFSIILVVSSAAHSIKINSLNESFDDLVLSDSDSDVSFTISSLDDLNSISSDQEIFYFETMLNSLLNDINQNDPNQNRAKLIIENIIIRYNSGDYNTSTELLINELNHLKNFIINNNIITISTSIIDEFIDCLNTIAR